MMRLATVVAFAFVLLGAATLGASAVPASTKGDRSYQTVALNDRVCCKRGWQDWWTTRGLCAIAGGKQTANRACREDWNDRWDKRWWSWTGGDWNRRICCKAGRRDWFTSARECRNAFGYQTSDRECRDDRWDNRWDQRWRNWRGDWNRRVCCKRGGRDWWTTALQCRNDGGFETAARACRRH